MPSSMPRPASQPRPVFQRVQAKQNRNSAFKPHQSLIERFYVQEGRELKWIMGYMKDECGLDLSVKQYKSQFKTWGFRHNLTQRDAAFILRLLDQARSEGRKEVVIFSGRPRRRDYILKYIKRNEKIIDEAHLLSSISDNDETPRHIRLQNGRVDSASPTDSQFPPTPPSASPSGSFDLQAVGRNISPMRVPIPSPLYTPRSSGEWSAADLGAGGPVAEAVPRLFTHVHAQLEAHASASHVDLDVVDSWNPYLLNDAHDHHGWNQSGESFETNKELQTELTHAAMSFTPAVIKNISDLDLYRILGEQIHSPQLKDGSLPAQFVMFCLNWLLCIGQNEDSLQSSGDCYLNKALTAFLFMLTSAEECLGALSVVAALFECYGQQQRLGQLLETCDELTKKHYGSENPLTMTINFMSNMLKGGAKCPPHDIPRLKQVTVDMQVIFWQSPRPALTARYHLAWAMLENELKRNDRRPESLEIVRREFVELTKQCEMHFGEGRIETIMAAATLARTTFCCGNGVEAERILSRSVMPRVRANFVDSHPYVWEAKHRHAFFLFQLARKEFDASRLAHLQLAEQLLREIVPPRFRVLGDSNPKSTNSFDLLKDVLKEQGKVQEANTLSTWRERETSG